MTNPVTSLNQSQFLILYRSIVTVQSFFINSLHHLPGLFWTSQQSDLFCVGFFVCNSPQTWDRFNVFRFQWGLSVFLHVVDLTPGNSLNVIWIMVRISVISFFFCCEAFSRNVRCHRFCLAGRTFCWDSAVFGGLQSGGDLRKARKSSLMRFIELANLTTWTNICVRWHLKLFCYVFCCNILLNYFTS